MDEGLDLCRTIGLNIFYYRKRKRWTQEKLDQHAKLSKCHLQRIETAAVKPSLAALLRIAEALEVEPHKLLEHK